MSGLGIPADYIPEAAKIIASAEMAIQNLGAWDGGLRFRYFGPRPLVEDGSIRSGPTALWDARVGYRFSEAWHAQFDVFNLFNSHAHQIDYFYATQLPGETTPTYGMEFQAGRAAFGPIDASGNILNAHGDMRGALIMRGYLFSILNDGATNLQRRVFGLYAVLIGANLAVWAWALAELRDHPVLLGTAVLAYTFGLRHAVDADHIATIDNVTRKLMQEGKRPIAAGFFFSLGHSTVVLAMSVGIAVAAAAVQSRFDAFKAIGAVVATCVSAFFLFAIAAVNVLIFASVYRTFRSVKRGERFVEEDMNILLNGRGVLARLFRPLFRMVSRSWHLLPIGLLFGLGFDTVTEVGLFGISAAQASKGLSLSLILVFPALFTAGMSLVDTTDSILMVGAYGWAFTKPIRKLFYNMTITLVSVAVAIAIGGIETLGLIADQFKLGGAFWDLIGDLNGHWGALGYVIIGLFGASWLVSLAIYRIKRYDEIDIRLSS